MKDMIIRFLKIFFIAAVGISGILLVFALVLALGWPWWVGFFLLLILAGLGIGGVFLRRMWLKRREQRFVQQVIEQDEARMRKLKGKEKDELKELQVRWKEAINALKRSHLRKSGNPLYVLPWYLVMGESGSGKTTAIKSARLSSPFVEVKRTSGISGTRNCDWWFFEQAILLDTAGRYAIPVDEGRDKEEWQRFLNLLVKYRKKEPIHGLIITVAADKLLETSKEALEEDGRKIRHRIDELMRIMGVKFPVYVLVSKCDLIQGMTRFCDRLPEKSMEQPMGIINNDLSTDIGAFLDRAINTIGERLRNLRLLLLHKPESGGVDPALLLFPEEFENLKQGLGSFMRGAFQENPYQETPVLRGLFFSSGRQEGSPFSHFLNKLGMIGEKEVLPGTGKGLFLHDFFSKILPADKGLLAPTRYAVQWKTFTRNLGLTSWVVIGVAICGLLSFSFVKNLNILNSARQFARPPILRGEYLEDLVTMGRFNEAILKLEDQNKDWWFPRFGLYESMNVEKRLKAGYCSQFKNAFLEPLDKDMIEDITNFNAVTPDDVIGRYVAHLARRINLIKARLAGQDIEVMRAKPQPSYVSLLYPANQGIGNEVRQKFGRLYFNYLIWRSDFDEINKKITTFESLLKGLLDIKGKNPTWIVARVNNDGYVPYITLKDFWEGNSEAKGEIVIMPAFTLEGKKLIDSFIGEIESALPDPLIFVNQKIEFERWHRNSSFDAWQSFSSNFSKGKERLGGREEWRRIAVKAADGKGPYVSFLNKMASDLKPLPGKGSPPLWLKQVYRFQTIKKMGDVEKGVVAKAAEKGMNVVSKLERKFGSKAGDSIAEELLSVEAYREYQKALREIRQVSDSGNQAYQLVRKTYTEDQATSQSPFFKSYEAADKLMYALSDGKPSSITRDLIIGPFDYLWEYALIETACHLQAQWEDKVLSEIQGVTGLQASRILLEQDGAARRFIKGPAEPFIKWKQKRGYHAKEILGRTVPFSADFMTFLDTGARFIARARTKETYRVSIKGLPTDVNPDARLKPQATHLDLQCDDNAQSLHNYHFPVSKKFNWSPENCGAVIFKIDIEDIVLTKKYGGPYAFPDFLQDFSGGDRTFYPGEFPEQAKSLKRLGIKYIKVNYKFRGAIAVLNDFKSLPEHIPGRIGLCWEQ